MAYVLMHGNCVLCDTLISFNPNKVPSLRINGRRQPLCPACVLYVNSKRKEAGLDEMAIAPGAYDPIDESEVDWVN